MIRLFVPNDLSARAGVVPTVDQSRYLTSVMRLSVGDEVLLFNGRDGEWRASIVEATKRGCLLKADAQTRPMEIGPDLDLIVAMVKRGRVETIVEKAAELGHVRASYFLAGFFKRCGQMEPALQRFRNIAELDRSAAYWAYRILKQHDQLAQEPGEAQKYRALAIRQGHLLAARDEIHERMVGKQGLRRIPGAVIDFLRLLPRLYNAAGKNDRYGYG